VASPAFVQSVRSLKIIPLPHSHQHPLRSAFTLVEIMIVVGIVGLLVALAIPYFLRYRSNSQRSACISNLKEIDYAMQQWALERKKSESSPVDFNDISPYLKGAVICPSGGTTFADSYSVTIVSASPLCQKCPESHVRSGTGAPELAGKK